MGLTIKSKFMSDEILKKRRQIIEKEKLRIQGELSKEEFESLYNKYGSSFDEKDFAWAFLDIDELKYNNLKKGKTIKTTILSYEYVSNEEFENIRNQVIEAYSLKHGEKRPAEEILEMYDKFGGRLSISLFLEEVLGIRASIIRNFKKGDVKNGTINFDAKPGEYNTFYKKKPKTIPMYVLNPDYIYELREKLFSEAGLRVGDSISYRQLQELNKKYCPDLPEIVFAQKAIGITTNPYNALKANKSENPINGLIFQDADIPIKSIKALTDKIATLHKLEAEQSLEREKFEELYDKYGGVFSKKSFAVLVLEMSDKGYSDTIENKLYKSVRILTSRKKTDLNALCEKIVKAEGLHHGDMLKYDKFERIHKLYAPNMPEFVFGEKVLGLKNMESMKYNGGRSRIYLKLPTAKELKELQKKVILETGIKINDKINFKKLEMLHSIYGGILPIRMFAIEILGINKQSFLRIKNDESKEEKNALALFNLVIPRSEIEKIREKIRLENNIPESKELTLEEIKELYTIYGGIMPPVMFAKEILGVSADSLKDLKDKKCDTTMICIRPDFNDEEVKQLKKYLAEGLSDDEIATKMRVTVAFLKINMNFLIDTKELTENNIVYEKVKLLNNQGKSPEEIIEELGVSGENVKEMLRICEKEEKEEEKRAESEIKQKKAEDRKKKKRAEIVRKAKKALDDYEYKEKSIKHIKAYIKECKKDFEKGEFLKNELEFLMECMIFVQCNCEEIEFFTRMCNYFSEYKMAKDFIIENIDNEDIAPEEKHKLRKCIENINYAIKQEKALEMLRTGTQTIQQIQQISNVAGIREVDVIKLKRILDDEKVSILEGGNGNEDDSISH